MSTAIYGYLSDKVPGVASLTRATLAEAVYRVPRLNQGLPVLRRLGETARTLKSGSSIFMTGQGVQGLLGKYLG